MPPDLARVPQLTRLSTRIPLPTPFTSLNIQPRSWGTTLMAASGWLLLQFPHHSEATMATWPPSPVHTTLPWCPPAYSTAPPPPLCLQDSSPRSAPCYFSDPSTPQGPNAGASQPAKGLGLHQGQAQQCDLNTQPLLEGADAMRLKQGQAVGKSELSKGRPRSPSRTVCLGGKAISLLS